MQSNLIGMTDAISRTIAVVDDDYRILESLESLLESAGHRVQLFLSAEGFLEAGIMNDVDCLISDIGMPGMDGYKLVRQVLLDRPGLPVFLITGREELIKAHAPAAITSERFFMKPFDGKKLLCAVADALRNSSSDQDA
jgi:FixJ family two-component response regulator